MSKTKKTKNNSTIENQEYYDDIKKAEEYLFYRKKEVLKHLNRKVPFVVFPYKYMKINDISFTIAEFGKVFIHLHLEDGDTQDITIKKGEIILYDPPGLITCGPGVEYAKTFVQRTKEIFKGYINLLEQLQEKYPNKTIFLGRDNIEFIDRIYMLEEGFSRKFV